ncbi:MAG: Alpha/Beta hydrolase protein [Linnemannia gamsii]|nr:MAG: Alpha/Beta hydrolase protein [Linnemannia gamsii]
MQRANSTGHKLPFRRRQSTSASPPVPYANPAATQFLRLGVGIDHVDVDQSDEEDAIYQGIENGMEGHDGEDLDTSDEEEEEEEGESDEDEEQRDQADDNDNNDDNTNRKGELLQQQQLPLSLGVQEQQQQQRLEANNHADNVRIHKPSLSIDSNAVVAQTQASALSAPSLSLSSSVPTSSSSTAQLAGPASPTSPTRGAFPPRILTKIDTQLRHKGETSSNDPSQPLSPRQQGPTSPRSPTSPSVALPTGLPVYHEKFTKAASTKIHGASPLSNVSNAVTASTVNEGGKPTSPRRRSTHAHQLTETILAPGTEGIPSSSSTTAAANVPVPYILVKRFPEQVGFATIHNWKIHYKVCYPTLDPAYRINGNGRNIVLFHGGLSNLGTWRKVQQTLADRTGCRVLSYDRVGHGLSDKPAKWPKNANPYKNGGVLAICQALLETLGMNQNLVLVGNGTGGTVASAVALSKSMSVRGLILLAPAIQDEAPPLYLRACVSYPPPLSWIYRGLYGDHGPLQQYYYKPKTIMAEPSTVEMYMKPYKEEGFWRGLSNATKYRSSYKIEKHLDRLTELSTLVMTGDVDDIVPTIETLRLFETLQAVRKMNVPQVLKIIKHAGHLPQEERPSDVVKVISFFVKKVCLGSLSRERSLGRRMSGGVQRSPSKKSVNAAAANTQAITDANTQANAQGGQPPMRSGPAGPSGTVQGGPRSEQGQGQGKAGPGPHTDLPMRGPPAIGVKPAFGHTSQAIKSH